MLFEPSVILLKIESTYGVDASPSASTDAFICTVPEVKPLGEHRERTLARPGLGQPAGINVGQGVQVTFSMELIGTDDSGDAPPKVFTPLRACGLTQTIVSLTSATLNPNSTLDNTSLTIYVYYDGVLHKITGCRGSFTVDFPNNAIPIFNFTFTGLYAGDHASDVTFPTPTLDYSLKPPIFRGANLTINGVSSLVFENITLNPNINVVRRPNSNAESGTAAYSQTGRNVEATLEPEAVALATFDPWTLYDQSTEFDITWTVQDDDDTPGQQWTFTLNNCQLKEPPGYGNRESVRTWPITVRATASLDNGNDDFSISCSLPSES